MSYYYCYTIGIMDKEDKIKPFGPYDANGNLKYVIEKSRSFASDLHEDFYEVKKEQITDELRKQFSYKEWDGKEIFEVKYLPIENLTTKSYLKKGYFLIDDVQAWEQGGDDSLFCNMITPEVYAEKMRNELTFGKNQPKEDEYGNKYTEPNASDYMYYAVIDYNSKEYEAEQIRNVAVILENYNMPEGSKLVALEVEG